MACDGWRATDGGSYQPNLLPWLANGYSKAAWHGRRRSPLRCPYADSTAYGPVASAVCEAVSRGGAPDALVRYP
jgi:hypothetical protein